MVIAEIRDRFDPDRPPLLIGAEARDILHSMLGHSFANRATQDVDLAFVLPDWTAYSALVSGLTPIPDTGIAFRIAGIHVDVMAFGGVEAPLGTLTPPFRDRDPIDVFGMSQVYEDAHLADLGDGLFIKVPTVPGYVALKLKAWIDRSALPNYKDAPDMGLALYWAAESPPFAERFWNDLGVVSRWEGDLGRGGAALLGRDMREVLGAEASDHIANLFTDESRDSLARELRSVSGSLLLGDIERRRALLDALLSGLEPKHPIRRFSPVDVDFGHPRSTS